MKKAQPKRLIVALLLGVFLLLSWNENAHAENLIINPGFEDDGAAGTAPPTGWTKYGGTFETSTEQVHSGSYSGKYYEPAATARYGTSTLFPVTGDTEYEWSGWIYDNNPTGEGYFKIFWCDAEGATISSVELGEHTTDNPVWQSRSGTITAPATAQKAKFRCYIKGVGETYSGAIYFDDVSFGTGGPEVPTVTTMDASAITTNSATLNCAYTMGTESSVDVYFQRKDGEVWSEIVGSRSERLSSGTYSFLWSSLEPGANYRFRAAMDYGTTTLYGEEKTFTTRTSSSGHMLINEFYGNPVGSESSYEWVEIYNPTSDTVYIGGYTLYKQGDALQVTIPESTCICPHDYYLITDEGWTAGDTPKDGHPEWPDANLEDDLTLTNSNSGIQLRDAVGTIIDVVGWGTPDAGYSEGTALSPSSLAEGKSWERIEHQDTDDNATDFQLLDVPTPIRGESCTMVPSEINEDLPRRNAPTNLLLRSISPNPFNASVAISYEIPITGLVSLQIYNIRGELIKTLVNQYQNQGEYKITWDGTDQCEQMVASGVYLCKVTHEYIHQTKKMVLLR